MCNSYKALEGFIRLPEEVPKNQFYDELRVWIEKRGGAFSYNPIIVNNKLTTQIAQHYSAFDRNVGKRYSLRINWDVSKQKVAILMMNPSHATSLYSDNTVMFMIQYVNRHFNSGSVWIVNMSPIIDPDSDNVEESYFIDDEENKSHIFQAVEWADIVFLAWGDKGGYGVEPLGYEFENLLRSKEGKLWCFRQSKKGNPIHRNQRPPIKLDHHPQIVNLDKLL